MRQIAIIALAGLFTLDGTPAADLAQPFHSPPPSSRPWVYWFPLDGNITSNGVTADLEAMARVGIGGVLYMETEQGTPKGPADFGGPLWRSLFTHACKEAARLGIEINMNNDAGWCGSGGPWITPELSMQKVVWTATEVEGPRHIEVTLQQPAGLKDFYGDIAVLAHPTPADAARIAGIQAKASFVPARGTFSARAHWPELPSQRTVPRTKITDLTASMAAGGKLAWDIPDGKWTILRIGHTTTGKENHPAPAGGRGLECDKLSKDAARVMFDGLMAKLVADAGPLAGKTLVSTHIDSWEVGSQNWTPKLRDEFRARRGYDMLPFMVAMTGAVVDSLEVSERFLWDLRQTISELLLENYAGAFHDMARAQGLRLSIEAYTTCPTDEMAYAGRCDEPMGEFWSWKLGGPGGYGAAFSCTEMASAAHIYGRPVVGAEAFTAANEEKWLGHPGNIKELGDWAFCEGINRFVFHRYALQPWTNPDRAPGVSMGPWGLHYERTQTWWEYSRPWHEYLARCQYLLQQGQFVADICLLGPEGSPQSLEGQRAFRSPELGREDLPLERPGHNFDTCPPDALLTRATVNDGRIVFDSGASYRILALPRAETMTPALLRKIKDLVEAGATIIGNRPIKSPSLTDFPKCDDEVRALAASLWDEPPSPAEPTARTVGKGRVFHGGEFALSLPPVSLEGSGLSDAQWIWRNEGKPRSAFPPAKRYFRRTFTLDSPDAAEARLTMTADNSFECYVNGQGVLKGNHFQKAFSADITKQLKPGANIIAVLADNTTSSPNPAGLIAALNIRLKDGKTLIVRTDASWLASETAGDDWATATAPPGAWSPSLEQGKAGVQPWGAIDDSTTDDNLFPNIAAVSQVLEKMGIQPDFAQRTRSGQPNLRYIHKRIGDADVYFVANRSPQPEQAVCSFRVTGKTPEIWDPTSGSTAAATSWCFENGRTHVPISLDEAGSVFVVFRDMTSATVPLTRAEIPDRKFEKLCDIQTPWSVTFDTRWGGPDKPTTFDRLEDWAQRPEDSIRFYSGTAIYRTTFDAPDKVLARHGTRPTYLDLGRVEVMAAVNLNGTDLGILWKPPYRLDVTKFLQPGKNSIEIKIVNLWVNRQIGDERLAEDSDRTEKGTLNAWPSWLGAGKPSPSGRLSFTSWRLWKKDDPLQPSGLIGPVSLQSEATVP
ncbi:MAG TPA: glycosyl hydrolase [Verrucomicrobiae bacterium]|nr:glycosyl hydrolase [Verrucomicrobiae bacterium]